MEKRKISIFLLERFSVASTGGVIPQRGGGMMTKMMMYTHS